MTLGIHEWGKTHPDSLKLEKLWMPEDIIPWPEGVERNPHPLAPQYHSGVSADLDGDTRAELIVTFSKKMFSWVLKRSEGVWTDRTAEMGLPAGEPAINHVLEELRRITRPGSNIFIVSDFRGLGESGIKHLYHLGKHCDVTAVRIYDPLEENLPPEGRYTITDGENRLSLYSGDPDLRRRYQEKFLEEGDNLIKLFGPLGIPLLPLSTLDSPVHYFRGLLGGRK